MEHTIASIYGNRNRFIAPADSNYRSFDTAALMDCHFIRDWCLAPEEIDYFWARVCLYVCGLTVLNKHFIDITLNTGYVRIDHDGDNDSLADESKAP